MTSDAPVLLETIAALRRRLASLESELARIWPVYEAAVAHRDLYPSQYMGSADEPRDTTREALFDAVDDARSPR